MGAVDVCLPMILMLIPPGVTGLGPRADFWILGMYSFMFTPLFWSNDPIGVEMVSLHISLSQKGIQVME